MCSATRWAVRRSSVFAGIDQRDAPRLGLALVHDHRVIRHVEGDVGHVQEVVGEIFLMT